MVTVTVTKTMGGELFEDEMLQKVQEICFNYVRNVLKQMKCREVICDAEGCKYVCNSFDSETFLRQLNRLKRYLKVNIVKHDEDVYEISVTEGKIGDMLLTVTLVTIVVTV